MFCYHCQEAKKNNVCDTAGICGKKANVSSLQDMLMFSLKGLAFYSTRAEEFGLVSNKTHRFIAKALYAMVTNVNFSSVDFVNLIDEAVRRRNSIRHLFLAEYQQKNDLPFDQTLPEEAEWQYAEVSETDFTDKGATVGVDKLLEQFDKGTVGLQECLLYAVKGLGSLAVHSVELNIENTEHYHFIQQALDFTLNKENSLDATLIQLIRSGEIGLAAMEQLEKSNSKKFGHPAPTQVYLDAWDKPGILVSGHDLQDIEDLLEQTKESDIDIYTHGEAISVHTFPAFKKYFNLVGNYGGAWQSQKTEFPKFKGPILVTTNSVQQPKKTYQDKIFTTGMVGWLDVPHIADRKLGQRKDFSALIEIAKQSDPPTPLTEGQFTTGYGTQALADLIEPITHLIKADKIKRIVIIAGVDGRHKERKYYTELAQTLPDNTLILSAGDCKYRLLNHDFGSIEGIPRLLDAGQSNDFSVIIHFLKQLQNTLNLANINQLPVSFNIAWYEQQTILMMLALLGLGFKSIRVGPTLPPFFTAEMLELLADKYSLKGIDTVENDIQSMMAGE